MASQLKTHINYLLLFVIIGCQFGPSWAQPRPNGTEPSFMADDTVDDGTPFDLKALVEPSRPRLVEDGIGDNHFNISFVPGEFDEDEQRPVGNKFYAKVREEGETDWKRYEPEDKSLRLKVDDLTPGTRYEIIAVSEQTDASGNVRETESRVHRITTTGICKSLFKELFEELLFLAQNARLYILLLILILALLLLFILCIVCLLCCRNKGQKYPVSKKERLQGRDNILAKDRGFADYGRT